MPAGLLDKRYIKMLKREPTGRSESELRPVLFETDINRYAEGSVLIKLGNTHVICTASIEDKVPEWLKGKGQGWITAEYSMLPRSTHTRSRREREKVSGRTHEIQRLIGRALRVMIDLKRLGERSITMDCDVIQADGGTRTASITGACVALAHALARMGLKHSGTVSAVSVGMKGGQVLTDLDYNEDSSCDVDMNFVITGENRLVEVQGTAEKAAFSKTDLDLMYDHALRAAAVLREKQLEVIASLKSR